MIKWTPLLLCLISGYSLFAKESAMHELKVETDHATFDGVAAELNGHVRLNHELGDLSSDFATLTRPVSDSQNKFEHLRLGGKVHLHFKDHGHLHCTHALFDHATLTGEFHCADTMQQVTYLRPVINKEGTGRTLTVCSNSMLLKTVQVTPHRLEISQLQAQGEVKIEYEDYSAYAAEATYQKLEGTEDTVVTLRPEHPQARCHLFTRAHDQIEASEIILTPSTEEVILKEPTGKLLSLQGSRFQEIDFKANLLRWLKVEKHLTLLGDVEIDEESFGALHAQREVHLYQEDIGGKLEWTRMHCYGPSTLLHRPKWGYQRTLTTHGELSIDRHKLEAWLKSPIDEQSHKVPFEEQIHLVDQLGQVFANRMQVKYSQEQGQVAVDQIHLFGEVKIYNRSDNPTNPKKRVEQYALADKVVYLPNQETMRLTAQPPNRVIFYDTVNDLQITATTILINRHTELGHPIAKGIGRVRIRLTPHELEKIKNHFSFAKII